jgi:hypothetical protein
LFILPVATPGFFRKNRVSANSKGVANLQHGEKVKNRARWQLDGVLLKIAIWLLIPAFSLALASFLYSFSMT